jgi:hypothetical protein
MWAMDWYIYETPKTRVSDWADFLVMVCSSSRIGEYIESSARQNSGRGLYYKVRASNVLLHACFIYCNNLTDNRISPSGRFGTNLGT